MIWRKLEIAFAQEIWNWGNVFEQLLDRTLFKISARSRNNDALTRKSQDVWKVHRYALDDVTNILRALYTKQFGNPVWATSNSDLIEFLYTRDTCCSQKPGFKTDDVYGAKRTLGANKFIEIAMKFNHDNAQVRRHMRQIIVEPSHIYATVGEDFELQLTLWDPHRTFDELRSNTVFKLEPEIPWLHYSPEMTSFFGRVPTNLTVNDQRVADVSGKPTHYKLEIGLSAHVTDILPKGVERETTVRAKTYIWIQNLGATVDTVLEEPTNMQVFFRVPSSTASITVVQESSPKSSTEVERPAQGGQRLETHVADGLHRDLIVDDTFDNSFDTEVSGAQATFVASMIPEFGSYGKDAPVSSKRSRAITAADEKPFCRDRALLNLIGAVDFGGTEVHTWMHSPTHAQKDNNSLDVPNNGCISPTGSMLAWRNGELISETQPRGEPSHESTIMNEISGESGKLPLSGSEASKLASDSCGVQKDDTSLPYTLYRSVRRKGSHKILEKVDDFLWTRRGYYDVLDDLSLDSDGSFLATGGCGSPQSPAEAEHMECEIFDALGRCGPRFNL
jgi:hypothetical protein